MAADRRPGSVRMGRRVRALREELGLSQKELAAAASRHGALVKRPWVSRVEIGDIDDPGRRRLDALAAALHTTPRYLETGRDDGEDSEEIVHLPIPKRFLPLVTRALQLPSREARLRAERIVDALALEIPDENEDEQTEEGEPTERADEQ